MPSGPTELVFHVDGSSDADISKPWPRFVQYSKVPAKAPSPWKKGRPVGSTDKVRTRARYSGKATMSQKFEFVSVSVQSQSNNVDNSYRTNIRRHVMLDVFQKRGCQVVQSSSPPKDKDRSSVEAAAPTPVSRADASALRVHAVDPYGPLNTYLDSHKQDLLHYYVTTVSTTFFSLEHQAGSNPAIEYWIPMAGDDSALLLSFIGCAAAQAWGYRDAGPHGLQQLQKTITTVNKRLTNAKNTLYGGTLALIAGMALYAIGVDRLEHWHMHMQGLKLILDSLERSSGLYPSQMFLDKIYRADLYGSLEANYPPYIDRYPVIPDGPSCERPLRSDGFSTLQKVVDLGPSLEYCIQQLEDAIGFWSDVSISAGKESNGGVDCKAGLQRKRSAAEAARTRQLLTDAQYTLFSKNGASEPWPVEGDDIFRPPSIHGQVWIGDKFRTLLCDLARELQAPTTSGDPQACTSNVPDSPIDFLLWAIFLAASSPLGVPSELKLWLRSSFMKLESVGYGPLRSWHVSKQRVARYLWVPSIHDDMFEEFWLLGAIVQG